MRQDNNQVIALSQRLSLLPISMECETCRDPMTMKNYKNIDNAVFWLSKSIRDDTFFSRSKLPISKILSIIRMVCCKSDNIYNLKSQVEISRRTPTDWRKFVRDVFCEHVGRMANNQREDLSSSSTISSHTIFFPVKGTTMTLDKLIGAALSRTSSAKLKCHEKGISV